ncbi:DUF2075 domain-containing protein [Leuconostocaceae bacterium ESL0958]|nr:DUF2075 domain-containing protein [Leuconostocaceae bacterium ESL0958]
MAQTESNNLKPFDLEALSADQQATFTALQDYILEGLLPTASKRVAVIEGQAGTGKSVLLTKLFKTVKAGQQDAASPYYGLRTAFTVNHPELLKVYQEMGARYPFIHKKDYQRPTSLINAAHRQGQSYDLIVVDEGHLLLSKPEPYIRFYQQNQLTELMKIAKVVVVVFDFEQVMQSKMYWSKELLAKTIAASDHRVFPLDFQYRMQANAGVQDWLNHFVTGALRPWPRDLGDYDLKVFDRAADLFASIREKNRTVGLSRMLATTGFPRRADGAHHVVLDDFDLPWDNFDSQVATWPNRPESINQVGSIYTVQGFDLNYAGLLLSPAYEYDAENDRIVINPDLVTHREIYKKSPHLQSPAAIAAAQSDFMFNALNILAKRGRLGLYLKAANPALNRRLLALQKEKQVSD